MSRKFNLGAMVKWTSQAGGCTVDKVGEVLEVVPAGSYPDRERFLPLYKKSGIGLKRDHESYVVRVKGRGLYWPRVSHLQAA